MSVGLLSSPSAPAIAPSSTVTLRTTQLKEKWIREIESAEKKVFELIQNQKMWTKREEKDGIRIWSHDGKFTVKRADSKSEKGYIKKQKEYKIWKLQTLFEVDVGTVVKLLMDLSQASKWNSIVADARTLEVIQGPSTVETKSGTLFSQVDLTYYMSKMKLVSARDFVSIRRIQSTPDKATIISVGIIDPDTPDQKDVMRGFAGPSGFLLEALPCSINQKGRCRVTWILNSDNRISPYVMKAVESSVIEITLQMVKSIQEKLKTF
jgi:hypothetical protein